MKYKKAIKIVGTLLRLLICLFTLGAGALLLERYEYLSQLPSVDNLVGVLPFAIVLIAWGTVCALCFVPKKKGMGSVCVVLAGVILLCGALFPNSLTANWWINYNKEMNTQGSSPDISVYEPFTGSEKLARLDGEPSLKLEEGLPQLDGAVALYPLYAAVAEAIYGEAAYRVQPERVIMTNTLRAYDGIIAGERDIIFVAGPSKEQRAAAEAAGVELVYTPIGKEAFVFLAANSNPVEGLTYQQIKNIYSGKTNRWPTLGWKEGGQIIVFQRPEGSGSQTGLQNIMGDMPLIKPQPLPDKSLVGSNSLMQQMSVEWKGVQPALGYSYRYFATVMYSNPNVKLLAINGAMPTAENITSGAYPFVANFYAVTRGQPQGNVKAVIDWILSDEGQTLIEKTGYSRLHT